MFLGRKATKKKLADGRVREYKGYVLLKAVWDKRERRNKQKYVAYIGKSKTIPLAKAKEICKRKGLKLGDLKRVRGLRVKSDSRV